MPKILVIEDEQAVLNNILELLNEEGFETIGADNGLTGLQLAQEQIPDLIICDLMMPKLDGFGVLEKLREDPVMTTIPLIFLTAKSDWSSFRRGMSLGADDYLTKPFTQAELLDAIAVRLEKQASVASLKQQIQQLQKSQLLQDEFVSTAAHELRGPLANIRMAIEMLHMSSDADDQKFYLNILQAACDHEVELINDLLDLQRLEALTELKTLELLNLNQWIPAIAEPFQVRAQNRQQTLSVVLPDELPAVLTDSAALQRVLTELLNNACKYTPPDGKILLTGASPPVSIDDEDAIAEPSNQAPFSITTLCPSFLLRPGFVYIMVSNTAEIPADALPHLFNQFYRVPGGDRWHQGGSGLGLTLVKKIVEQLTCQIHVLSDAGWTHFMIELPVKPT
jgi:two-component system, sensor histidine kinase and response regulator